MTTQPLTDIPPGFDDLTKEEQIAYLQALWNRIAETEADVPVPDWHLRILEDRLAAIDAEKPVAWSTVRERLQRRHDE